MQDFTPKCDDELRKSFIRRAGDFFQELVREMVMINPAAPVSLHLT